MSIFTDITNSTLQLTFESLLHRISITCKFIDTVLAGLMIIITFVNVLITTATMGLELRVISTATTLAFLAFITWYYKPRLKKDHNENITSIINHLPLNLYDFIEFRYGFGTQGF